MEIIEFNQGENIITQGQDGDYFYIIEKGTFNISVNGSIVSKLGGEGSSRSFGDLALLHNTPRAATIRSTSPAVLFSLDRDTFRYTIAQSQEAKSQSIEKSLSTVPLLSQLNPHQLSRISETVELVPFKSGDQIIVKGSVGNIFYMIKEGTVNVSEVGEKFSNHTLTSGEYFGERALITGEPRAANVHAATDCVLLTLDRDSFQDLLGPLKDLLDHNMTLRTLMTCSLFEKLTNQEKSKAAKYFNCEKFPANKPIVTQGENGGKFYIVKEGNCNVMADNKQVGTLAPGAYFGEMSLLDDEVRKATVLTTNECEVCSIDRVTFTKIMGPLKELLLREKNTRMELLNGVVNDSVDAQLKLKFKDLTSLAVLGSGTFGKVTLVQHCNTKSVYALKAMLKSEIVAHKQQTNVMNEKNVMVSCNNPFVLRLYQTFKDNTKLYMLLEFIQGGELFSVLHTPTNDGVPEPQAKFYSAGVLIGLSYMHSKKIAYRDMKPENCLIDNLGYPKIVDFGFAKVINNKSYTLCGTPEYLAPELVLGKGHNLAVDYWAFGILVFEMIAGYSPFSDTQGCDQVIICRNIVSGRLSFPRNFNADCKDMIKRFLYI
jgi:cGMP-dependent protein kinase